MYDETKEYLSSKTSFVSKFEDEFELKVPSVIICPSPIFKPSKIEKYKYEQMLDLLTDHEEKYKVSYNLSIFEMYQEVTYTLDQDFELFLRLNFLNKTYYKTLKLTDGHNPLDTFGYVNVSHIATYRHGLCILIKSHILQDQRLRLFLQSINNEEPPNEFEITLVDENTWQGMVDDDWPYYKPDTFKIPFKNNTYAQWNFKLTPHEIRFLDGQDDPTDCQEKVLKQANCTLICYPLTFNYLEIPPCQTYNETDCMSTQIYSFSSLERQRYPCLKPKIITEFRGEHFLYKRTQIDGSLLLIQAYFLPTKKEVKEEMYVLGPREYIGYIGGSLGLLLGFSCYTYILCLIDKILDSIN